MCQPDQRHYIGGIDRNARLASATPPPSGGKSQKRRGRKEGNDTAGKRAGRVGDEGHSRLPGFAELGSLQYCSLTVAVESRSWFGDFGIRMIFERIFGLSWAEVRAGFVGGSCRSGSNVGVSTAPRSSPTIRSSEISLHLPWFTIHPPLFLC